MTALSTEQVLEFVQGLADGKLVKLAGIIVDEQKRREQEAFLRLATEPPTDDIGREIAAIQAKFAAEKAAEAEQRAEARHRRMLDARDAMRAGQAPAHFKECGVCARAILTLRHDLVCPSGKGYTSFVV